MVNKQQSNLQDIFLNNARKNKITLVIHLLNGFQLKGVVKGFDNFTVILDCDNKQMLIYKHSISTITPAEPILFTDSEYLEN
ncbi:RNA chaperone Hfq [Clostridium saccharoperbutylacetonicum]|uniref:RNA chaperone Hfq n=1 Tax=Clostridium saccharoperbutylacetonicum TaxID=36745 RepID=UPI0039EABB0F